MMDFSYCKIEVYIPETHFAALQKALQEADAGHIGKYDSCLSYSKVMSCWRPLEDARPYIGQVGAISTEAELKVETVCLTEAADRTVYAIKQIHPYEEPRSEEHTSELQSPS